MQAGGSPRFARPNAKRVRCRCTPIPVRTASCAVATGDWITWNSSTWNREDRSTSELEELSRGVDLLVLDGAMYGQSIHTHLRIEDAVPAVCGWEVAEILLTQIGRSAPPHDELAEIVRGLCSRAAPAYDGLVVDVGNPPTTD